MSQIDSGTDMARPAIACAILQETAPSLQRVSPAQGGSTEPNTHEAIVRPLHDTPVDPSLLSAPSPKSDGHVLYLAYGSNLAAETFLGKRGIKPIGAVNVAVPSLRLAFDLPGLPYAEPCFSNTARRDPTRSVGLTYPIEKPRARTSDYHKDRWHKPLVGVVYELTQSDYAHVIATEGGGASYHDILVDCYPLEEGSDTVPSVPDNKSFKAHTLFAPTDSSRSGGPKRPDPSYAQPSRRYLNLLIAGAREHDLPGEYRAYLEQIRTYSITTFRQRLGQTLIVATWGPVVMSLFGLQKLFQDKQGRNPQWLSDLLTKVFVSVWRSYDVLFKPLFGDGERTKGESPDVVLEKGQAAYQNPVILK